MKGRKQHTLGSYIRTLRLQHEMTQASLANQLGVTDKAVSKWERDVSYPDMALFPRLADLLGVSVCDLLSECIEDQPSRLLQIYEMNHDIRTPLHIIIGYAHLAQLHQEDPAMLKQDLENIRVTGEYLLQVIEQMMAITQQPAVQTGEPGKPASSGEEKQPKESGQPASFGHASKIQEQGQTEPSEPTANPQEPSRPESPEQKTKDWKTTLENYNFTGKRILVAEDVHLNREIIAEMLHMTGADVEMAEDGQACLDLLEKAPAGYYDLVLMDIRMPVMDGFEATRRIRSLEDPQKAAIPVIALSANTFEKERRQAYEAGMNAFAEKPISLEKLFQTLEAYLK